jgi:hypothetical protein
MIGIIYFLLPLVLLFIRKKIIHTPPQKNELHWFFLILGTAIKQNHGNVFANSFWDSAKPSILASKGIFKIKNQKILWNDKLVNDIKRTINACKLFLWYPLWILNNGGIGGISSLQAASMKTNGTPGDVLGNLNVSFSNSNINDSLMKPYSL